MLIAVAAPVTVITVPEAKAHFRVDHGDDDGKIADAIDGVLDELAGEEGWLGRSLGLVTWEWSLDWREWREETQGRSVIMLPRPPLRAVISMTYRDWQGASQTFSAASYGLYGIGAPHGGGIALKAGVSWPSVGDGPDAVIIRFTAGYETLPPALREAILCKVARRYDARGEMVDARLRDDGEADRILLQHQVMF